MTEPTRTVVRNQTVINVIILDDPTATLWHDNGTLTDLFGANTRLIDTTNVDPPPSIGWGYDGQAFTAPPQD